MRVRIVQVPEESIEGLRFHSLQEGAVYDFSQSLATFLTCEGYAEPVDGVLGRRQYAPGEPIETAEDRPRTRDRRRTSQRD